MCGHALGNLDQAIVNAIIQDISAAILLCFQTQWVFALEIRWSYLLQGLVCERLNLCGLMVEGDSQCIIRWVFDQCNLLWTLLDEVEEVVDMA